MVIVVLPIYGRDGTVIGLRRAEVVSPPLIPILESQPLTQVLHGELRFVRSPPRYVADMRSPMPELATA